MGFLGILSLDTAFPRIRGDAGNPASWPFPARVQVIPGAGSTEIVRDGRPRAELLQKFIEAAKGLEAEGAFGLVSTCGFLVTSQQEIAAAVRIPVMLSALSLYPLISGMTGGRRIGILTASASNLGPVSLGAAGIPPEAVAIGGMENESLFREVFLAPRADQRREFDPAEMEALVISRALKLLETAPDLGGFLLECGNLPPYAAAIRRATKRPAWSVLDGAALLSGGRAI